jgi:hypothetical protein
MDTLFYDVRKMRDRQVCDALEQFDETGPMRAMGMGMGDSASSGAVGMPDSTVLQRPAPRVRRRVVIPVAGALILAGVLLVAFSSALGLRCNDNAATRGAGTSAEGDAQRGGEPEGVGRADDSPRAREEPDGALAARPDATARPRARVAAMGDTLAHPRNVTLELSIRPKRAQSVVRFRGRLFWGSEFQMQVPRSAQSEIVEVRAPGYRTVRREVRLSTDVRQTIRLRATRRHVGRGPSRKLVRPRPAVRSRQAVPPGRARPRNAADLTKDLPED